MRTYQGSAQKVQGKGGGEAEPVKLGKSFDYECKVEGEAEKLRQREGLGQSHFVLQEGRSVKEGFGCLASEEVKTQAKTLQYQA